MPVFFQLKLSPDSQSLLPGQRQELLDMIEKEQNKLQQQEVHIFSLTFKHWLFSWFLIKKIVLLNVVT